jgi:hypothetical protein
LSDPKPRCVTGPANQTEAIGGAYDAGTALPIARGRRANSSRCLRRRLVDHVAAQNAATRSLLQSDSTANANQMCRDFEALAERRQLDCPAYRVRPVLGGRGHVINFVIGTTTNQSTQDHTRTHEQDV